MGSFFDCPDENEKGKNKQLSNTTSGPSIPNQTSMMPQSGPMEFEMRGSSNYHFFNDRGFNAVYSSYHTPYDNNNFNKNNYYNNINNNDLPNKENNNLINGINNLKEQQNQLDIKGNIKQQQNNGIEQIKNDIIEKEKNNLINETSSLKVQINELKNKLNDKENIILQKNKEIELFKNKNIEYENEKKNYINEKNNLINETKNLNVKISEFQKQLSNKDAFIMQGNKENEQLKKIAQEYETMKIIFQNKENEFKTNLNNAIIQTKAQYEDIMLKQREEMEKYKKENEQIKIQFESEKNNLKKELEQFKKENSLLKMNKEPILVGLNNIGATCYMNATLQCLSNTTNLTEYFLKKFNYEQNNKKRLMSNEYYNVVNNLWDRNNNNKSFSPESFKEKLSQENPLFKGIQANDSKDLINFLLERFHLELNEPKNVQNNNMMNNYVIAQNDQLNEDKMLKIFINEFEIKYNSIISNLFYGMFETKSQCQKCKNIKYNFQVYSFLEFPLEQVNKFCFNQGKRQNYNSNKNPDVDLYECFEYNSNLELMSGDNQMYCNICNSTQDALYGTQIYSAPNYLIINLNRGRGAVYECNVNFPEKLNIINFITFKNGNTVFELYAVICHLGPSSMSGHFVAYCKKKKDDHNKWYLFNDAFVSECKNQEEYRNGMPYILFYKAI